MRTGPSSRTSNAIPAGVHALGSMDCQAESATNPGLKESTAL